MKGKIRAMIQDNAKEKPLILECEVYVNLVLKLFTIVQFKLNRNTVAVEN